MCAGGAVGSGARYLVGLAAQRVAGDSFPWGTLAVNVGGSFTIGVLMFLGVEAGQLQPTLRIALTTGLLGGFTTFSAFAWETTALSHAAPRAAIANVAANVLLGLGACVLGRALARRLAQPF